MAFEQRSYAGGAVQTTITQGINATDLTIELDSSTGWPTGGANGPFFVVINKGLSNEEKVEVQSRSGTTLTVASTGKRGVDGTSAAAHSTGSSIAHCFVAQDAAEANSHIANTSLDHHTQYLTSTRHGAVSHTQAMLGTNSVGAAQIQTGAVGADELANDAVDTAAIQDGAVTHDKLDADAVDGSNIEDDAVDSEHIAAGAINSHTFFDGISPIVVAATDPGSVGANKIWFNTTNRTLLVRNAGNSAWEVLMTLGAGIAYTPTLTNITVGTGGYNYGRYRRIGKQVIAEGSIRLGSGGDVTGPIAVGLPVAAADLSSTYTGDFGMLGAGRAVDASAGQTWGSVGYARVGSESTDTSAIKLFGTGGSPFWTTTIPFDWTNGDSMTWFCQYEAASAEDSNYVTS